MARILVVDDSAIMRKNLHTLLTQAGHVVAGEAGTGQDAIEAYARVQPDLVTMDITMPGMDGVNAVKQIRARYPEACIIVISAEHQKNLVYEALKSGARHYLTKPLRLAKLTEVLAAVLDKAPPPTLSAEAIPLPPAEYRHFGLEDRAGILRLSLHRGFEAEDCGGLRTALSPLAQVAPLQLEIVVEPGLAWDTARVAAVHGVLADWQAVHGAPRWLGERTAV